jgi:hypothetical protein
MKKPSKTLRSGVRLFIVCSLLTVCSCASGGEGAKAKPAEPTEAARELDAGELATKFADVNDAASKQDEDGLKRLIQLSQHHDYLVRIQAYKALAADPYRQTDLGYAALLAALNDSHWIVRSTAAKALGKDPKQSSLTALQTRLLIETNEKVKGYLQDSIEILKSQKLEPASSH